MTAGLGARLAEVADERPDLAAVVRDEREDAADPLDLGLLAPVEPLGEPLHELTQRRGMLEYGVALADVRGLQLDEGLLLQVAEGRDDPAPLLAEVGGGPLGIDARPDAPGLAARDEAAQEVGARRVEGGEDVVERAAGRAEAVAGIERCSLSEEAVELEVGEDRLQHERPHVVPGG